MSGPSAEFQDRATTRHEPYPRSAEGSAPDSECRRELLASSSLPRARMCWYNDVPRRNRWSESFFAVRPLRDTGSGGTSIADRPQEVGLERLRKGALLRVSLDPPSHMTVVADEQAGRNRVYLVATDDATSLALQRRVADPGRFEILPYLACSPVTHLERDETILRARLLEALQPGPVHSASPAPCRPEVQGKGLARSRERRQATAGSPSVQ